MRYLEANEFLVYIITADEGAILAGLITDARLSDPRLPPVVNPGGYLRGMVHADERGELNLISSFMGLLARRAQEEENELR